MSTGWRSATANGVLPTEWSCSIRSGSIRLPPAWRRSAIRSWDGATGPIRRTSMTWWTNLGAAHVTEELMERRFRVGIVGLSAKRGWATTAHVPALRALSDYFELVGVANTSLTSAESAAAA